MGAPTIFPPNVLKLCLISKIIMIMVKIPEEELYRYFNSAECRYDSIFQGSRYKVYMQCRYQGEFINILAFDPPYPKGIFNLENAGLIPILAYEPGLGKSRYIHFGNYVISLQSPLGREDYVDFSTLRLYGKEKGTMTYGDDEIAALGGVYAGRLLVIDECLLVVCQKDLPQFCIAVDERLTRITPLAAEQILRNLPLNWQDQEAVQKAYPAAGWIMENGILYNPSTGDVPSCLQFYGWVGKKRNRGRIKANLDFVKLMRMFTRSEKKDKPLVKYIKSDHLLLDD